MRNDLLPRTAECPHLPLLPTELNQNILFAKRIQQVWEAKVNSDIILLVLRTYELQLTNGLEICFWKLLSWYFSDMMATFLRMLCQTLSRPRELWKDGRARLGWYSQVPTTCLFNCSLWQCCVTLPFLRQHPPALNHIYFRWCFLIWLHIIFSFCGYI